MAVAVRNMFLWLVIFREPDILENMSPPRVVSSGI
jgi:hypothetical protein